MSVGRAAPLLVISVKTQQDWILYGRIDYVKIGTRVMIRPETIREMVDLVTPGPRMNIWKRANGGYYNYDFAYKGKIYSRSTGIANQVQTEAGEHTDPFTLQYAAGHDTIGTGMFRPPQANFLHVLERTFTPCSRADSLGDRRTSDAEVVKLADTPS